MSDTHQYLPMSSEEEKVALVVQRHHLPPLELGHLGEEGLEQPSDGVPEARDEPVQHKLGEVVRGPRMSLHTVFSKQTLERGVHRTSYHPDPSTPLIHSR